MNRVSVVGTTGSGKTTFAAKLGEALAIPHVELDALNWSSNWTPASPEVFRSRVKDVADAERWVIDGNYLGNVTFQSRSNGLIKLDLC